MLHEACRSRTPTASEELAVHAGCSVTLALRGHCWHLGPALLRRIVALDGRKRSFASRSIRGDSPGHENASKMRRAFMVVSSHGHPRELPPGLCPRIEALDRAMNCLFSGLFLLKIIIEASTNIQLSIQESSGMKFALLDHRWKVLPGACGLHEQRCRFRHTPDGTSKST